MNIKHKCYTPQTIDDIVFHSDTERDKINDIVNDFIPFPCDGKNGILLYGIYGTGKTTLAKLLPDAIENVRGGEYSNYDYFACMQGVVGTALMKTIDDAVSVMPLNKTGNHYFVLDEVDNLTDNAQASLKSAMNWSTTVFIMTTNHIEKIDKGVMNRCVLVEFNAAANDAWLPLAKRILQDMNVNDVEEEKLLTVIAACKGSARDIVSSVREIGIKRMRAANQSSMPQKAAH